MPAEIVLIPDKTKIVVVRRVDGRITNRTRIDPNSVTQQEAAARVAGVKVPTLLGWIDAAQTAGKESAFTAGDGPDAPEEYTIREMHSSRETGEHHKVTGRDMLARLLPPVPETHVIEWADRTAVCCLDVDYHGDAKPPHELLLHSLVRTRVTPRPYCWHLSRGKGLHLFYVREGDFTAEELAAVAALKWRTIDPTAGLELKRVVRGPDGAEIFFAGEQDTTGTFLGWIGSDEPTGDATAEYLDARGMEVGRRYAHDKCPIHPTDDPGDKRDPVVVMDSGIFCFLCEGKGRVFGSRRPGYVSWATLLGHPSAGDVGGMVRNLCHWGHAKWILQEQYRLSGPLAALAYRAALKAYHAGRPTEPLVELAFDRDLDILARVGKDWGRVDDLTQFTDTIKPTVAKLPALSYLDAKGNRRVNDARLALFMQRTDLGCYGYPSLNLIYGCKLAAEHSRTKIAVPNPLLVKLGGDRVLPRYVPVPDRMPLADAKARIETLLPKVNWDLLYAIMCGVGAVQETELGEPPRIFVTGPSGAAKSSHFKVAAGILALPVAEPTVTGDEERFRQKIIEGLNTTPIVVVDEILKDAYRNARRTTPTEALQFLLNLTPGSMTHVLYKGPRAFDRQFVLGMTEIELPQDLRNETQIARRVRHVRLHNSLKEWRSLFEATGLDTFEKLRLAGQEYAEACNAIVSDLMDRYFAVPRPWQEQAEELGLKSVLDYEDLRDPTPLLRRLFRLVCAAPDITSPRLASLYAGYKCISQSDDSDSDLYMTYSSFSDGTGDRWFSARRLTEKDWSAILGVDEPVKLAVERNGNNLLIRWYTGTLMQPTKVNQQIVDPSTWS